MKRIVSCIIILATSLQAYNYGHFKENVYKCEKQEDARACHNLGSMYLGGRPSENVPDDKKKTKQYYDRSIMLYDKHCDGGDGKACFELADLYNGMIWNIKQDLGKMAHYYEKSCDAQYGKACIELGAAYKRGTGIPKDQEKSKMYYAKGVEYLNIECENDNASSCDMLSTIYQFNMYGTNDRGRGKTLAKKSFALYQILCDEQKDSEGCFQIATDYKHGIKGIAEVDWRKAKSYFEKSCKYGEESACWRGKEIDVSKQVVYEKQLQLQKLRLTYLSKMAEEESKWKERVSQQQKDLNAPDKTDEEKRAYLTQIEEENKVWKSEQKRRLEQYQKEFEDQKKEMIIEMKKLQNQK